MNPRQLFLILRDRYKVVALIACLVFFTGYLASEHVQKRYMAEASVMVDVRSPDPISALLSPGGVGQSSMGTQVDIIRSDRVARKVVKMLHLDESPVAVQMWQEAGGRGKITDWMANRMQIGLRVTPSRESSIITIAYEGTDPVFVAAAANAFAQAYVEAAVELRVEPAREYARWFGEQAKQLRENVEKAQARVSEFQRSKGIVVTNESLDFELAKLNELSARMTSAQGETRDAQSKQRAESSRETMPEVMGNPVVQGLRTQIADRETRLKEMGVNLGTRHPQYLRTQSELEELKNRLAVEIKHVAGVYSSSSAVGRSREAEIQAAMEAQKKKLLRMRGERDEIEVLLRDVDTAKRAYEAVTNRYNQASLEAQATQTNVSVLTPASEPLEPSFPKPLGRMIPMLLAFGLALGVAAALGLETVDRRIRSADDLAEMLQVPVLAVVEQQPRRLAQRPLPALPRG